MTHCMSRVASDQVTKCSASDLASEGIRVISINPSAVQTNFFEASDLSFEQIEETNSRYSL